MSVSDEAAEFWEEFSCAGKVDISKPYQVWYFGNTEQMAAELAELVIAGKKVATASLLRTNELQPDKAPLVDGYSVVTDYHGRPLCILRTTEIDQRRFVDVDEQFAKDEGEGDGSLEYWRNVHREYFERESTELGFEFDDNSIVCCERFTLLHTR
jgi:uncharacterized protein YhfF